MQIGITPLEKCLTIFAKVECPQLGILSVGMHMYIHQNTCTRMFMAAPLIIPPNRK